MAETYTFKQTGKAVTIHAFVTAALSMWTPIAALVYAAILGVLFALLEESLLGRRG